MTGQLLQLECVAAGDLPAVLTDLWRADRERVQVSIASAPVGRYGEGARTVRPLSVWKALFDLAGFDVVTEDLLNDPPPGDGGEWSGLSHWLRTSPFRGDGDRRRRTVGLRRRPAAVPQPAWCEEIHRTLGLRPPATIKPGPLDRDTHLVFLVGTYQEFRQYHALWQALPVDAFTVLLRDGGSDRFWTRRRRCMEAWLTTREIAWRAVPDVRSVEWESWPQKHRVLIAGADSSVFRSHVLNGAFVASARMRGWKTVQLQHGIWPYADADAPMTMTSALALTWSGEFRSRLREIVTWPDGRRQARGDVEGTRFVMTGCPSFDRYADASWPRLDDLLGDWVARYRRRVLVATNLHWSQHRKGEEVNPAIVELARHHADTLFIVKTHPAHDPDDAFVRACPPNVQVLDELCCLFADLDSARLVLAADAVISTLSTVALEAAVARRPLILLDTGNPNRYEHVEPVDPGRLGAAYEALFVQPTDSEAFVNHYVGSGTVGRATRAVFEAIAEEAVRPPSPPLDEAAIRPFVETVSTQGVEAFALEGRIAELEERLDQALRLQKQHEGDLLQARRRNEWLQQCLRDKDAARLGSLSRPAKVALFGASSAGMQCAADLARRDGIHVHCFLDNDPARWGSAVAGVRVRKPSSAAFDQVDFIVVSSVHVDAISRQVVDAGYGHKLVLDSAVLAATADTLG